MRIFKTKALARFAKNQAISDESLVAAIETAKRGLIDADLGGGLIKQRVARPGQRQEGRISDADRIPVRSRNLFIRVRQE